jgi:hypothetical protein
VNADRDLGTWWVLGVLFGIVLLVLVGLLSLLAVVHNN